MGGGKPTQGYTLFEAFPIFNKESYMVVSGPAREFTRTATSIRSVLTCLNSKISGKSPQLGLHKNWGEQRPG